MVVRTVLNSSEKGMFWSLLRRVHMEVKLRTELGIKVADPNLAAMDKKVENFAHLPGRDMNNAQIDTAKKEASALKPSQAREMFRVEGNSINLLA